MKKIIVPIFALLFMASCSQIEVWNGRKTYKTYFKKVLKDPESLKIYDEKYVRDGLCIEWEIDYGARNEYGGMVRKTIKITTVGNTVSINGGLPINVKDL